MVLSSTGVVLSCTGVVLSSAGVVLSSTGVVLSSACWLFTVASGAGSISSASRGPFLPFRLLDLGLTFLLNCVIVILFDFVVTSMPIYSFAARMW